MKRRAGKRVDLYKLIDKYNELNGNVKRVDVGFIKSLDLDEVEEEIRRVQEFIEDIQHFNPLLEKSILRMEQEELRRDKDRKLNNDALELQDIEDMLMGRRTRRASDVINDLENRIARLERRSSVKVARSIPRPPRNRSLVDIKRATNISDKALDKEYGYGLSKPGTFGYEANKYSSLYALEAIMENLNLVLSNPDDKKLIEIVADSVHDGWSYAAYNVDDPRYETQPEKRDNRIALADASYRSLSEGEKEKDRVIARALIWTVYMAEKR
tara:strand:+ start:657 stop:1466 length:810 start_codon:yes stop_codon:yes gene_type:complete